MKESKFNEKVQNLIQAHDGYIVKTIVSNKAGVHDLLVCLPGPGGLGRFCSLEGKKPTGNNKMSALQIAHRNKVIRTGGLAKEVKTLRDVLQIITWAKQGYKQTLNKESAQLKQFNL